MRGKIVAMVTYRDYIFIAYENGELWQYYPGPAPYDARWVRVPTPDG